MLIGRLLVQHSHYASPAFSLTNYYPIFVPILNFFSISIYFSFLFFLYFPSFSLTPGEPVTCASSCVLDTCSRKPIENVTTSKSSRAQQTTYTQMQEPIDCFRQELQTTQRCKAVHSKPSKPRQTRKWQVSYVSLFIIYLLMTAYFWEDMLPYGTKVFKLYQNHADKRIFFLY